MIGSNGKVRICRDRRQSGDCSISHSKGNDGSNRMTSQFIDPRAEYLHVELTLTLDEIAMINQLIVRNQSKRNTHGPLNPDVLVNMLLQACAEAMKDENSFRGAPMAALLDAYEYVLVNL
jgi:hypothetical protein